MGDLLGSLSSLSATKLGSIAIEYCCNGQEDIESVANYMEVGSRYLDHLTVERKYAEATWLCPKLSRGSASPWERWVFHFVHLCQFPVLVPYIPTENPVPCDITYEIALVALATIPSFHKDLLSAVKPWPRAIYSALPVIAAIEPQLNISSMTDELKEALAVLYEIDGQYEKAFALYADLWREKRKPSG